MRVEQFFLFFGPKLVSVKRGETEYGIAAIPAGGYVKISGMNPDDELPRGGRAPRLLRTAGLEADRRDRRRARRSTSPSPSRSSSSSGLTSSVTATQTVGEVVPKSPAGGVLEPGDRIARRRRQPLPQPRPERPRSKGSGPRSTPHDCAGGSQMDGCIAATPARLTIERDGRIETVLGPARIQRRRKRAPGRLRLRQRSRRHRRRGSGRRSAATSCGKSRRRRSPSSPTCSTPNSARKSPAWSGPATSPTRRSTSSARPRRFILLAVVSLSLGLINLFPFLPLDGGHIFWSLVEKVRGKRGPLRGHGARRRDRLRARDHALLPRPLERHRPAHRRRLQRPLARASVTA